MTAQQGVLDISLATGKVGVIFLIGRIQFGGLWSPGVSFFSGVGEWGFGQASEGVASTFLSVECQL